MRGAPPLPYIPSVHTTSVINPSIPQTWSSSFLTYQQRTPRHSLLARGRWHARASNIRMPVLGQPAPQGAGLHSLSYNIPRDICCPKKYVRACICYTRQDLTNPPVNAHKTQARNTVVIIYNGTSDCNNQHVAAGAHLLWRSLRHTGCDDRRKVLPDGYCQQSRELTVADAPDSRIGPTVQWTFRSRGS